VAGELVNGNLLNLNNIGNLKWYYNNTLNKLTKADKSLSPIKKQWVNSTYKCNTSIQKIVLAS
jgi:hypothetical protein